MDAEEVETSASAVEGNTAAATVGHRVLSRSNQLTATAVVESDTKEASVAQGRGKMKLRKALAVVTRNRARQIIRRKHRQSAYPSVAPTDAAPAAAAATDTGRMGREGGGSGGAGAGAGASVDWDAEGLQSLREVSQLEMDRQRVLLGMRAGARRVLQIFLPAMRAQLSLQQRQQQKDKTNQHQGADSGSGSDSGHQQSAALLLANENLETGATSLESSPQAPPAETVPMHLLDSSQSIEDMVDMIFPLTLLDRDAAADVTATVDACEEIGDFMASSAFSAGNDMQSTL